MAQRMAGADKIMEITSTTNQAVKDSAKLSQKKFRHETGLFLIEGQKAVEEAFSLGVQFEKIFILKEKVSKYTQFKSAILANEAVMKKISTTETAPEIIAVAKQIIYKNKDIINKNKIVLLENIKDNGNLGTIIRTCTALGVDAIILSGETADIYNPKTVRSAVGNLFKIPVLNLPKAEDAKMLLKEHTFFATVVPQTGAENITAVKIPEKSVIMFGSEAEGLSENSIKIADKKITIPISKNVESLNLSTAVTICIWELLKNV